MPRQHAYLLGASGLTGGLLCQQLLADDRFSQVTALVRSPLPLQHPKLKQLPVNFNDPASFQACFQQAETVFCCIGTTRKKVRGDLEAYTKIDRDIPLQAARYSLLAGCKRFLLVSSVGANADSRNFYLKLKGSLEMELTRLPLEELHLFRPSMLMGPRKEKRLGESLGKGIMRGLGWVIPAAYDKYKPIPAEQLAAAMRNAAFRQEPGTFIYQFREIRQWAQASSHPSL